MAPTAGGTRFGAGNAQSRGGLAAHVCSRTARYASVAPSVSGSSASFGLERLPRGRRQVARAHPSKPTAAFGAGETVPALDLAAELASTPLPQPRSGVDYAWFRAQAAAYGTVPVFERVFTDALTPVEAYRRVTRGDCRGAPSFLFESVVNEGPADGQGRRSGRYSFVGARPSARVIARGRDATVEEQVVGDGDRNGDVVDIRTTQHSGIDPLGLIAKASESISAATHPGLPPVFSGGWVGFVGYDSVRYGYSEDRLGFSTAPEDDRRLPDIDLARYDDVIVFDDADKLAYLVSWVHVEAGASEACIRQAYEGGLVRLADTRARLQSAAGVAAPGTLPEAPPRVQLDLSQRPASPGTSNMSKDGFLDRVRAAQEHMRAGDIFQLVLSQRFARETTAEPLEIYRALRVVNPSPYMIYLQAAGCTLVASSPEILCRVESDRTITNRPLAGTRPRGRDAAEDVRLEAELRADAKEVAEHVMLVDLGRNDVGRVAKHSTVRVDRLMDVERYSHVMHISSTVTGKLRDGLTSWDALRAALPVGTISGAPKVRAMQLIDELEPTRRGPYGGGIGYASYNGTLDMALALRTLIIPDAEHAGQGACTDPAQGHRTPRTVYLQAGAGLVADSVPESEYQETVNKAAALGRAIDLAEDAFADA